MEMAQMSDLLINKIKEIYEPHPKIHGWCSVDKALKFVQFILDKKPELCVEIGVFGGSSLIPQAMAIKNNGIGKIYGIDPWSTEAALEEMQNEDHKKWWGKLDIENIYQHAKSNIAKYGVEPCCVLIRDKAENVVDQFKDNSVDILHIDGNHSEELAYKDAVNYLPKVKSGGIIFFDDIYWTEVDNHVTTRKAITYLLQSCERIDLINSDCLVLQKS